MEKVPVGEGCSELRTDSPEKLSLFHHGFKICPHTLRGTICAVFFTALHAGSKNTNIASCKTEFLLASASCIRNAL